MFKVGERVRHKGCDKFLGYVSDVFKGHLFLKCDPEILVHLGEGKHVSVPASGLELYTGDDKLAGR